MNYPRAEDQEDADLKKDGSDEGSSGDRKQYWKVVDGGKLTSGAEEVETLGNKLQEGPRRLE